MAGWDGDFDWAGEVKEVKMMVVMMICCSRRFDIVHLLPFSRGNRGIVGLRRQVLPAMLG